MHQFPIRQAIKVRHVIIPKFVQYSPSLLAFFLPAGKAQPNREYYDIVRTMHLTA